MAEEMSDEGGADRSLYIHNKGKGKKGNGKTGKGKSQKNDHHWRNNDRYHRSDQDLRNNDRYHRSDQDFRSNDRFRSYDRSRHSYDGGKYRDSYEKRGRSYMTNRPSRERDQGDSRGRSYKVCSRDREPKRPKQYVLVTIEVQDAETAGCVYAADAKPGGDGYLWAGLDSCGTSHLPGAREILVNTQPDERSFRAAGAPVHAHGRGTVKCSGLEIQNVVLIPTLELPLLLSTPLLVERSAHPLIKTMRLEFPDRSMALLMDCREGILKCRIPVRATTQRRQSIS